VIFFNYRHTCKFSCDCRKSLRVIYIPLGQSCMYQTLEIFPDSVTHTICRYIGPPCVVTASLLILAFLRSNQCNHQMGILCIGSVCESHVQLPGCTTLDNMLIIGCCVDHCCQGGQNDIVTRTSKGVWPIWSSAQCLIGK